MKRETRFTSKSPANEIISKIEEAAAPMGFDVKKNNYKVIVPSSQRGVLSINFPCFMIMLKKKIVLSFT